MGPSTEGEEPEVQEQIQVRQLRTTWRIVAPVGEASLFSRQSVGLDRGTAIVISPNPTVPGQEERARTLRFLQKA